MPHIHQNIDFTVPALRALSAAGYADTPNSSPKN